MSPAPGRLFDSRFGRNVGSDVFSDLDCLRSLLLIRFGCRLGSLGAAGALGLFDNGLDSVLVAGIAVGGQFLCRRRFAPCRNCAFVCGTFFGSIGTFLLSVSLAATASAALAAPTALARIAIGTAVLRGLRIGRSSSRFAFLGLGFLVARFIGRIRILSVAGNGFRCSICTFGSAAIAATASAPAALLLAGLVFVAARRRSFFFRRSSRFRTVRLAIGILRVEGNITIDCTAINAIT